MLCICIIYYTYINTHMSVYIDLKVFAVKGDTHTSLSKA